MPTLTEPKAGSARPGVQTERIRMASFGALTMPTSADLVILGSGKPRG